MKAMKFLDNKLRGWLPKEPLKPNKQTQLTLETSAQNSETENNPLSKGQIRASIAIGIANLIMGSFCLYLVLSFLISPNSLSYELNVLLWLVFMVSWLSINFLLFRNFKKHTQTTGSGI